MVAPPPSPDAHTPRWVTLFVILILLLLLLFVLLHLTSNGMGGVMHHAAGHG